jgi:hypothetical protein
MNPIFTLAGTATGTPNLFCQMEKAQPQVTTTATEIHTATSRPITSGNGTTIHLLGRTLTAM